MMYRRPYLSDRRKFQRLQCHLSVWLKVQEPEQMRQHFADKEIETVALNLSEGGLGLLSQEQIPQYTVLSIKLAMLKGNASGEVKYEEPLELKGKVCYCYPSEDNKYRLGICFTEVPVAYKAGLANFLTAAA